MNTTDPSPNFDPAAINDRVTAAVRSHRIKIRVLTSVAFLFSFFAVAASVLFVWCYLKFYLPKQEQMLHDAKSVVLQSRRNPAAGEGSVQDSVKRIDIFLDTHIVMTYMVSMGTTVIAIVVGILGLGTLVLLTVVVLTRRIAPNQLNASLAQISNQLRELQTNRSPGPPAA